MLYRNFRGDLSLLLEEKWSDYVFEKKFKSKTQKMVPTKQLLRYNFSQQSRSTANREIKDIKQVTNKFLTKITAVSSTDNAQWKATKHLKRAIAC